jgi:hypothetical protein
MWKKKQSAITTCILISLVHLKQGIYLLIWHLKDNIGPVAPCCSHFIMLAEGKQKLLARKKNKTNGSNTNMTEFDLDVLVCNNERNTEVRGEYLFACQLGYNSCAIQDGLC